MGGVGVTMLLLLLQGSHALLGTRYPLLVARTPPRCARAPSLAKMEEREQPVASWPLSGSEGKSGNKSEGGIEDEPLSAFRSKAKLVLLIIGVSTMMAVAARSIPALGSGIALAISALLVVGKAALGMVTSPGVQSLFGRLVTRLIDWGVPVVIIVLAVALSGDSEPSPEADGEGLLKRLLKGDQTGKMDNASPSKVYLRIESLSEKLSSMAFTVQATTESKAGALRVLRRRRLETHFADELGDIGDTARSGVAAAEASWRAKSRMPAAAAAAARSEIRSLAVQLGGETSPSKTVTGTDEGGSKGGGREGRKERARKSAALKQKMRRAERKLAEALEDSLKLEVSFLKCASDALGHDAWEARAALAKLVTLPVSWDPNDEPLPHRSGTNTSKRAFVLDFEGDSGPAQVSSLREEVTAIVHTADSQRGDSVILRLVSGGGSVTGYGLAMAQLLRLKAAGLHLTICVEQVAASGGYMMACVADRIVASPFAVVNLRDLHANPHPHAHIHVCFELVCRCSARSA